MPSLVVQYRAEKPVGKGKHLMKLSVIGCGRWGTFLAWYLERSGSEVTLYGRKGSKRMEQLLSTRSNGVTALPPSVRLTQDLPTALQTDTLVISVGSQSLRGLLREIAPWATGKLRLVLCMKGLETGTGKRLSTIVKEELGEGTPVAVWLGPGHVQEFTAGIPNCMVIDSEDEALKEELISAFSSQLIRFYYGRDLIGNEIGGASKNVIGIAAGMLDGLGLSSLKGALMSRGTREIARLIQAMGGSELSAYGLCHLGDYEATVFSQYSHNRRYGEAFVRGEEYTELAEGCATVKALVQLGEEQRVSLPICKAVDRVLYQGASPRETLDELFSRSLKQEF